MNTHFPPEKNQSKTQERVIPLHAYHRAPAPAFDAKVYGDHCDENQTRIVRIYYKEAA